MIYIFDRFYLHKCQDLILTSIRSSAILPAMITHRVIALGLTLAWTFAAPAGAASVGSVEFADRYEWNGTPLRLNGAGLLRYRVFIKGYAAALYLGEGVEPDQSLDDVPRRLEIEYLWSIPADAFARATVEQISRSVDAPTLARLRSSIDQLNELYTDVQPGDRYSLTYVPGLGTELALNGEARGLIQGAEFSAALFGIWIGLNPVDEGLRKQLLTSS